METRLRVLYTEKAIEQRICELAEEVNEIFKGEEVVVVAVLAGSVLFASDLIQKLNMPVQLEFIRLSSYGDDTKSCGKVKPVDLTLPSLEGKNVLIVEDIVDSGLTAKFIMDYIKLQHRAANIKFVTMLDKACARKVDVQIDLKGFEVDERYIVGYGMDYKGYYRNLPYIGYISE